MLPPSFSFTKTSCGKGDRIPIFQSEKRMLKVVDNLFSVLMSTEKEIIGLLIQKIF